MQYVYARYGRNRAGIAATVIHYRPRSALREIGKALGLSEDVTARLASTVWGSHGNDMEERRYAEAGFDPGNARIAQLTRFVGEILTFPPHPSQPAGAFAVTAYRLNETGPRA